MSMYGSVTDGQVFSKTLEDNQMEDITSCNSDLEGDIINWENNVWNLKSPYNTTEMKVFDYKKDVCSRPPQGMLLVKLNFIESLHACARPSGEIVGYVDKRRFGKITHFLSKTSQLNVKECTEKLHKSLPCRY